MNRRQHLLEGYMDSLILAEAIATVMGYEEKELCKPGRLALAVMLSTATTVLGTKKRVYRVEYDRGARFVDNFLMKCCFAGLRITFNGVSGRKGVRVVLRKTVVRETRRMRGYSIFVHENGH